MAGSISLSLSQQFDSLGKPLDGGLLYFYAAGTTTPQSAYQDTGLVTALPNPLTLDSAGRVPQLFFADGNIKIRLTDANGVVQLAADNILVIGQSSGGGGGATVDPTTVLQTGWIQPIYGIGSISGFVRANGRTIGNAASGATERAFADTSALFIWLYNADASLAVAPGGRGASAATDYAANKTIALPDWRGRGIAGLDDMGSSAAGRLTGSYFGASATILGASGGNEKATLGQTNLPNITLNVALDSGAIISSNVSTNTFTGGTGFTLPTTSSQSTAHTASLSGGGATVPIPTASPMMLATIYIKL